MATVEIDQDDHFLKATNERHSWHYDVSICKLDNGKWHAFPDSQDGEDLYLVLETEDGDIPVELDDESGAVSLNVDDSDFWDEDAYRVISKADYESDWRADHEDEEWPGFEAARAQEAREREEYLAWRQSPEGRLHDVNIGIRYAEGVLAKLHPNNRQGLEHHTRILTELKQQKADLEKLLQVGTDS